MAFFPIRVGKKLRERVFGRAFVRAGAVFAKGTDIRIKIGTVNGRIRILGGIVVYGNYDY